MWNKVVRPMFFKNIRVLITNAASGVSSSLAFLLSKGEGFGLITQISLILYDAPEFKETLDKTLNDLKDCCYPYLKHIIETSDIKEAFSDISVAFLIASNPVKENTEESDYLAENVPLFKEYGEALENFAKKDVKIIIASEPVNANLYICSKFAPSIPKENFTGLSRLNINRAVGQIAKKLEISSNKISKIINWGNHSTVLGIDFTHATAQLEHTEKKLSLLSEAIPDDWLKNELLKTIKDREENVQTLRKKSLALSVAKAITDHARDLFCGREVENFTCMSVFSDGSYDVSENLVFSFPVCVSNGKYSIVRSLSIDENQINLINLVVNELEKERDDALLICEQKSGKKASQDQDE